MLSGRGEYPVGERVSVESLRLGLVSNSQGSKGSPSVWGNEWGEKGRRCQRMLMTSLLLPKLQGAETLMHMCFLSHFYFALKFKMIPLNTNRFPPYFHLLGNTVVSVFYRSYFGVDKLKYHCPENCSFPKTHSHTNRAHVYLPGLLLPACPC